MGVVYVEKSKEIAVVHYLCHFFSLLESVHCMQIRLCRLISFCGSLALMIHCLSNFESDIGSPWNEVVSQPFLLDLSRSEQHSGVALFVVINYVVNEWSWISKLRGGAGVSLDATVQLRRELRSLAVLKEIAHFNSLNQLQTLRETDKLTGNRRLHTKVSTSPFLHALVAHTMKSAKLWLTNPFTKSLFHFSLAVELVD